MQISLHYLFLTQTVFAALGGFIAFSKNKNETLLDQLDQKVLLNKK